MLVTTKPELEFDTAVKTVLRELTESKQFRFTPQEVVSCICDLCQTAGCSFNELPLTLVGLLIDARIATNNFSKYELIDALLDTD